MSTTTRFRRFFTAALSFVTAPFRALDDAVQEIIHYEEVNWIRRTTILLAILVYIPLLVLMIPLHILRTIVESIRDDLLYLQAVIGDLPRDISNRWRQTATQEYRR